MNWRCVHGAAVVNTVDCGGDGDNNGNDVGAVAGCGLGCCSTACPSCSCSSLLLRPLRRLLLSLHLLTLLSGNYILSYLATKGPSLQNFVCISLIQLVCKITQLGWFDDPQHQELATDVTKFLHVQSLFPGRYWRALLTVLFRVAGHHRALHHRFADFDPACYGSGHTHARPNFDSTPQDCCVFSRQIALSDFSGCPDNPSASVHESYSKYARAVVVDVSARAQFGHQVFVVRFHWDKSG
jgi:hypothetical protein